MAIFSGIKKDVKSRTSFLEDDSFKMAKKIETNHKNSYSHGLEAIYAFENVDLSTVKPLRNYSSEPKAEEGSFVEDHLFEEVEQVKGSEQQELDLGEDYRGWMDAFVLKEPIQVLGLSQNLEKILHTHEKKMIGDLVEVADADWMTFKGIGLGHIDEIQKKLKQYTQKKQLYKCRLIDFLSLIRSVMGDMDPVKVAICTKQYGLDYLLPLTPSQKAQLRRADQEKLLKESLEELKEEKKREKIQKSLEEITNTFIKPWIRNRKGLASRNELYDRLLRISYQPEIVEKILFFIEDVYFKKDFILKKFLIEVKEGIFSTDDYVVNHFNKVHECSFSYFYKSKLSYGFRELVGFLTKEFSLEWDVYPDGFIEKVLRLSSNFKIRKDRKGELRVWLT